MESRVTEIEDVPQIEPKTAIGIDVGLKSLVALSTGETIQYHRVHQCPNCGLEMDRDVNASLNIVTLGLRGLVNSAELTGVPDRNLEHRACRDTAMADR